MPKSPVLDAALGYPAAWAAALQHLTSLADGARQHGIELVEVDMAKLDEVAALLYDGPWVAERHATVRDLLDRDPDALDPTVRQVIARAIGQTATTTFEAQYHLRALQAELSSWWDQIDLLMVPTAPTHPTFAEVAADPLGANSQLGRYTNFVNLLGWSALALPAGETARGLPFGVTFIGPAQADAALANFGRMWEGAVGKKRVEPAEGAELTDGTDSAAVLTRQPASEATLALAVVGAHLSGLPLNWQLTERGARLISVTHTAPVYQLYALPGTTPPKPGMVRVGRGDAELGTSIAVEVWAMPQREVGSFLALIPAPLGLGSLQLADGSTVHGFVCEAHAVAAATDISHFGGWRAYLASLRATP
mgnify:FL=1